MVRNYKQDLTQDADQENSNLADLARALEAEREATIKATKDRTMQVIAEHGSKAYNFHHAIYQDFVDALNCENYDWKRLASHLHDLSTKEMNKIENKQREVDRKKYPIEVALEYINEKQDPLRWNRILSTLLDLEWLPMCRTVNDLFSDRVQKNDDRERFSSLDQPQRVQDQAAFLPPKVPEENDVDLESGMQCESSVVCSFVRDETATKNFNRSLSAGTSGTTDNNGSPSPQFHNLPRCFVIDRGNAEQQYHSVPFDAATNTEVDEQLRSLSLKAQHPNMSASIWQMPKVSYTPDSFLPSPSPTAPPPSIPLHPDFYQQFTEQYPNCRASAQVLGCLQSVPVTFVQSTQGNSQQISCHATSVGPRIPTITTSVLNKSAPFPETCIRSQPSAKPHHFANSASTSLPENRSTNLSVFLTYSRDVMDEVDELILRMKKQQIQWFTFEMLEMVGGHSMPEKIEMVFKQMDFVVPVLSPQYLRDITSAEAVNNPESAAVRYLHDKYVNKFYLDGSLNHKVRAYLSKTLPFKDLKNVSSCLQSPLCDMNRLVKVLKYAQSSIRVQH